MPQTVRATIDQSGPRLIFADAPAVPADHAAIEKARAALPNLRPTTLGLAPSFGFGDRLGLGTPGHVLAVQKDGGPIRPIFAQQSIREMTRTNRTPRQVMDDATFGTLLAGYSGPVGADADHLKTPEDVDRTADAGFIFFTIDPSGEVDASADNYTPAQLAERYAQVAAEATWVKQYQGKSIKLATGTTIELSEQACMRAAVKYGRAINAANRLAAHIANAAASRKQPHEIELSVDETPQPTTLAEHWIIAELCLKAGMKMVSLAPRFIGDFEKGVDYKGDIAAFERSLADHAAIARMLGPYKLSLHSGSDKLSVYGLIARHTKGLFHVKTAGTSYLEALRVVARHDAFLFRRLIDFSRSRYDTDKATYHVSATLAGTPEPRDVADNTKLEGLYLGRWADVAEGEGLSDPGRQIMHCTFGSVLTDATYGPALRAVLNEHRSTYNEVLAFHFGKHLQALRAGM